MEAGGAVAEVEEEWCCCLAINGGRFFGHCDEGQSCKEHGMAISEG
jgi:hypothetical protein